jgi:beta-xylosidase
VHNDSGALPLSAARRVAVVGPGADDPRVLFGCYAFPNHVLPQFPEFDAGIGIDAPSLLTALRAELPTTEITHHPGCPITGGDLSGIDQAVSAATAADVVVLVVGDRSGLFGEGTSGEGCDAADLRLPGHQSRLVEAVLATGRPVVLLAVSGRPYALGEFSDRCAAVVQAFFPGEEGGAALAGVLSGRVNPSGRLPVELPRHAGAQPHTYLEPPLGQHSEGISNLDPTPAFPFGHGISYTSFGYDDLVVDAPAIDVAGTVEVSVVVTNTGRRTGEEVVQLYVSDPVASVTRPVTQLVGFARVPLEPEESARVRFTVHADRLSFTGRDLARVVEPGEVRFRIGTAGDTTAGPVTVRLTGRRRVITGPRVLDTPATVTALVPERL